MVPASMAFVTILDKVERYLRSTPISYKFGPFSSLFVRLDKKKIIHLRARFNGFIANNPEFGCKSLPPFFRRADLVFCFVEAAYSKEEFIQKVARQKLASLMAYSKDCLVRERIEWVMLRDGIKDPLRYSINLLDCDYLFDDKLSSRVVTPKVFET